MEYAANECSIVNNCCRLSAARNADRSMLRIRSSAKMYAYLGMRLPYLDTPGACGFETFKSSRREIFACLMKLFDRCVSHVLNPYYTGKMLDDKLRIILIEFLYCIFGRS